MIAIEEKQFEDIFLGFNINRNYIYPKITDRLISLN